MGLDMAQAGDARSQDHLNLGVAIDELPSTPHKAVTNYVIVGKQASQKNHPPSSESRFS